MRIPSKSVATGRVLSLAVSGKERFAPAFPAAAVDASVTIIFLQHIPREHGSLNADRRFMKYESAPPIAAPVNRW